MTKLGKLKKIIRFLFIRCLYFWLYISSIVIFAMIYIGISDHFYYPTVKYESAIENHRTLMCSQIAEFFQKYYTNENNDPNINMNSLSFRKDSVKPCILSLEEDFMNMTVTLPLQYTENDNVEKVECLVSIKFPIYDPDKDKNGKQIPTKVRLIVDGIHSTDFAPFRDLFMKLFPHNSMVGHGKKGYVTVKAEGQLLSNLAEYERSLRGRPTRLLEGMPIRMFYFSAVTITTLGYGDIVPLTTLARFFVAMESILGIVLIGLFLKSLTDKSRK